MIFLGDADEFGSPYANFTFSLFDNSGLGEFNSCGIDTRRGVNSTTIGTVTITLNPVNDLPVARYSP